MWNNSRLAIPTLFVNRTYFAADHTIFAAYTAMMYIGPCAIQRQTSPANQAILLLEPCKAQSQSPNVENQGSL
jgi:hypothetical protein